MPGAKLGAALDMLAEAVLRPTFPAVEVDRLVKQRLDGIVNELANPGSRVSRELAKAFYAPGTLRALPRGGTAESVACITADAAQAFYVRRGARRCVGCGW